jgi:TATA-binding protein-associated factor Taf7
MRIDKLIRTLKRNLEQTSDPDLRRRLIDAIERLRKDVE